jgi:hypothetical protein
MEWISSLRARRHVRASFYRAALEDLPDGLEAGWRHSAPQEFPGIRTDAFFFVRAAEGLMVFFSAAGCSESSRPCALPSEAADSVWHAWLRRDPIGLERFCRKHFGAVVPHVEREGLGAGALANTLSVSRALEGIAPLGPRLPLVFGLDAQLRMARGHGYWRRGDEIVYARLGKRGRYLWRARPHPELTIDALLAAGVVDAATVEAHRQRRRLVVEDSDGGSFTDGILAAVFASNSASADDGGGAGSGNDNSSDNGCDSGSSCGSSCGGGGD